MEQQLQFSQTGKKWCIEEDQQLITEYNEGNDIIEIAKIHKRLPNGIATRLVSLNVIEDKINAKGYTTYKNSEYYQNYLISEKRKDYQEKIKSNKCKKLENEKQLQNEKPIINNYLEISQDISNIKNELKEIKSSMIELKEMLKAIYEFDDC